LTAPVARADDGRTAGDAAGRIRKEHGMAAHTYGISEIVGTSETSIDDAIKGAIARANKTMRNLDWFEVAHVRGHLEDGAVAHYQVTIKVGFRIED
jgi:flavin-binding protein dodecin